jgi:anti-anti-sigma regulatory factor
MNVGGDLYDVTVFDDGRIALYVADAAGHGVAAAMLSVLFKQILKMSDEDGDALQPAEVLRRVNARLAVDVRVQGLFLTVGYVLVNAQTGELKIASAGHTPILLYRASGESVLLERTGPALGLVEDADFTEHHLVAKKGDRLMLYTDGLIDGLDLASNDEILDVLIPFVTSKVQVEPDWLREQFHNVERLARESDIVGGRDDVTLLLLEIEDGQSSFDNDPLDGEVQRSSETTSDKAPVWNLWIAEDEANMQLSIRGRGNWLQCEAFRRLAMAALDSGKQLTVDLAHCTMLDSACLGTLHEIVASGPDVTVHSPGREVQRLFEELGLEQVLQSMREERIQPPCEPIAVKQDLPASDSAQRLLKAHEILSELSEENREQFKGVVEGLRAELGEE